LLVSVAAANTSIQVQDQRIPQDWIRGVARLWHRKSLPAFFLEAFLSVCRKPVRGEDAEQNVMQ